MSASNVEITMPRLSDTMQEGTIARWLKHAGDEVKKGDILAEIETDKATMDLAAYEAGTLEQILVQEGETVPIGQAVAVIGSGAGSSQTARAEASSAPMPAERPDGVSQRRGVSLPAPSGLAPSDGQRVGTIKVSPLARRMAEEHGIDLRQIQGTGPGGRIVRDDIEDYL